ncbi:MAG TPA: Lrp/AsnC family transcriptional regulator [Thermoanaerobaculia bacterium]|nr:Lrp/AsnC family transcriptional regulator [Thermoanaerobaculia bacterium]
MNGLDALDRAILRVLQDDGRITNTDLASRIGLTAAPTLERVRKLEREGFLRKYVALVDQGRVGKPVTAFVAVIMKSHGQQTDASFRRAVAKLPEVLECHHIAGEEDYLLKVVTASPVDYERFVLGRLLKVPAIEKIKTTFVLSSSKLETRIPIEPEG